MRSAAAFNSGLALSTYRWNASSNTTGDIYLAIASASPEVAKFAEGKPPKKIVVVPGRLVNVVV